MEGDARAFGDEVSRGQASLQERVLGESGEDVRKIELVSGFDRILYK